MQHRCSPKGGLFCPWGCSMFTRPCPTLQTLTPKRRSPSGLFCLWGCSMFTRPCPTLHTPQRGDSRVASSVCGDAVCSHALAPHCTHSPQRGDPQVAWAPAESQQGTSGLALLVCRTGPTSLASQHCAKTHMHRMRLLAGLLHWSHITCAPTLRADTHMRTHGARMLAGLKTLLYLKYL